MNNNEEENLFIDFLAVMFRFKWLIGSITLIFVIFACLYYKFSNDFLYTAKSQVEIKEFSSTANNIVKYNIADLLKEYTKDSDITCEYDKNSKVYILSTTGDDSEEVIKRINDKTESIVHSLE